MLVLKLCKATENRRRVIEELQKEKGRYVHKRLEFLKMILLSFLYTSLSMSLQKELCCIRSFVLFLCLCALLVRYLNFISFCIVSVFTPTRKRDRSRTAECSFIVSCLLRTFSSAFRLRLLLIDLYEEFLLLKLTRFNTLSDQLNFDN